MARATAGLSIEITETDVDSDPLLRDRYGHEVPVVLVDGRKAFKFRVDETRLRRLLGPPT